MGKRSKSRGTANEELSVESNKKKRNKLDHNDESKDETLLPSRSGTSQTKSVSKVKKSKKIIFNDDDDAVEVESTLSQDVTSEGKKTKLPIQTREPIENEENIKDEDIDKFCDEINEEDNEQYESWIKLLEAKLNPNKKKNK